MEANTETIGILAKYKGKMLVWYVNGKAELFYVIGWTIGTTIATTGFLKKRKEVVEVIKSIEVMEAEHCHTSFLGVFKEDINIRNLIENIETYRNNWLEIKDQLIKFDIISIKM